MFGLGNFNLGNVNVNIDFFLKWFRYMEKHASINIQIVVASNKIIIAKVTLHISALVMPT